MDIIRDPFAKSQAAVAERIGEIMAAVEQQDCDRLESYHLWGPKFTKFDDWEPLDRQDAEITKRIEREGIGGAKGFRARAADLKVDVFGPVAVATFVFEYEMTLVTNEEIPARARATMVFVQQDGEWLITHEHFSAFKSNL